jgi:gliding motility-associated-like protein
LITIEHIYPKAFYLAMIKKSTRYLTLLVLFISLCFCADAGYLKPASGKKNGKKIAVKKPATRLITAFKIPQQIGLESIVNSPTGNFIGIPVHAGTDVTAIAPTTITTSPGNLTVSPAVGVPQNFTTAVGYTIGGLTYYSVNVLQARAATPICNGLPTTITGDPPPAIQGTYGWEILNQATGTWSSAPGPNSITGADYQTPTLSSNANAPKLYTFRRSITTAFGTAYDSYTDLTVNPNTPITGNSINQPSAANSTFCVSGNPGIITGNALSGGIGTYTYRWQSSTGGGPFTDITGATAADLPAATVTATTIYQRIVSSGTCTPPTISNKVTITIINAVTNNLVFDPGTTSFCGPSIPLIINGNIPSGGTGVIAYQWASSSDGVNFTNIPGNAASPNDYNVPALAQTTWYRRLASSGVCSTLVPSDHDVKITIQPGLGSNIISTTGPVTFCVSGDPGVITGSPPTGGDGTYTYQWQSSTAGGPFIPILNTNVKDYSPGTITVTTSYLRTITSGACTSPLASTPVTITIQPSLANNTIAVSGPVTFCASGDPGIIKGSPPTGGDGTYTYQWQSSTAGSPFVPILNTNVKDYSPGVITATTSYLRTITSGTCTTPLASTPITITITPAITSNIINQPPNAVYCATSSPVTITVQPPAGGDGTYTYQWTSSTDNVTYNPINGATAADYVVPALTATTWFKRVVSSGACIETSTSNPVVITVYKALANNILTPPPVSSFCQSGDADPITGMVPTGGDGNYTYQWQQSSTNTAASFTDISGQTGPNFDPPNLVSTMFYRRVVMNGVCTTPLISNVIEIHITPPITFSSIQSPPFSYCVSVDPETLAGSPPQGGDGGNSYQYKWYSSTDNGANWNPINGATGIDYDPPTITTTTWFRRDATSGACQVPFPSNIAKIVVNQTPADVAVSPVAPICAGNKVIISVISPDPALTYIWYDAPTKDNILFTGPAYTTDILTASQTFYVEASNGTCPSPLLTSATVTVNPLPAAPTLVTNPVSTCQGTTATLNISNPQPGYTYNWYTTATGGTPVFTNINFTTPSITNNITYYAEAVNGTGCISATRTPVNVSPIPLAQVKLTGASVCPGEPGTLTSDNIDPTIDINWFATPTSTDILYTGNSFITPPVTANTTYYAEVANSCVPAVRASAQVRVIQQLPAPVVSVESAVAPSITFWWVSVPGATGYEVSTDNGQTFTAPSSGSNGTTHTVTGLQIGQSVTIIVRATGGFSCQLSSNSAPVTGTATNPLVDQIFVANAFTPNGDGKNDIVYVHNENIKSLKFYVYDQWGELLYVSQSQQNGWDGNFKGKTEPAGVYVYYLEAIMNDGQQVKKKGTITLLR